MSDVKQKSFYLQFEKGREFPVFLRFINEDFYLSAFQQLESVGFKKVEEKTYAKLVKSKKKFHLLNVVRANTQVSNIIKQGPRGLHRFGDESVTPHKNYQVYKYNGYGLMVYSPFNAIWELGTICDLTKDNEIAIFKSMINRFLSVVLVDYDVAAFWGVPVEEGIVVLNQAKANNEVVYIDVKEMNLLTIEGVKPIFGEFEVLRLDELIKSESKTMKKEELFSFLMIHTSYISYYGPSHQLKALIYQVISFSIGRIYPEENFIPRTDDLPLAS